MFRFLGFLLSAIFAAVVFSAFIAAGLFYYYGAGLPSYRDLADYKPSIVTRLYANDGRLFAEYATQRRIYLPIDAIPKKVITAFLSAEDKTFYHHFGLDLPGIISASISNISRVGQLKRPVGASTITQQVAKNFLLSEISHSVSIERKIKEAILALRIEKAYSKDYILELYLNEIYLGGSSYGVAAAALNYFNKSLDELNIAEVAFLAGLPKAPSRYNPLKYPERAKARRDWVIMRMYEDGNISKEEAEKALSEPLAVKQRGNEEVVHASYFAEEVRRELVKKFGENVLYKEGLVVRTTLDPRLQKIARDSLKLGLLSYDRRHGWRGPIIHLSLNDLKKDYKTNKEPWLTKLRKVIKPSGAAAWELAIVLEIDKQKAVFGLEEGSIGSIEINDLKWARKWISENSRGPEIKHPNQVFSVGDVILVEKDKSPQQNNRYYLRQVPEVSGALVVMDPHTGRVLAMQGGFSYEMSQFNRVTQAKRQPGSALKAFIYLAAFEKGLNASTIIKDEPFSIDLGYGQGVWRPQNYYNDFLGPITLRSALEKSRNLATINMVNEITGIDSVIEIASRFNIVDNMPRMLAMILGAGETTLLKLTTAFAMLANGGKKIETAFLDRIQDRNGKNLLINQTKTCQGCNASTYMLGKIPKLYFPSTQVANPAHVYQLVSVLEGVVKRGTGHKLKELNKTIAAKTGTTNDFHDAWCIAFTPDLVVGVYVGFDSPRSLGKHEGGTKAASPIILDFMKEALKDTADIPFKIPAGIKLVRVNPHTGKSTSLKDKESILEAFTSETELNNLGDNEEDEANLSEPLSREEKDKKNLFENPPESRSLETEGLY